MLKRIELVCEFVRVFAHHALHVRELIGALLLLMLLGGVTVSQVEGIKLGDAIYFAFVTGLSIGYGDISPETAVGKVVSVGIGLVGMLFIGMTVAIATRALADTAERHVGDRQETSR